MQFVELVWIHGKSENLESPVTESLYQRTGLRQSEVAAFQINLLYQHKKKDADYDNLKHAEYRISAITGRSLMFANISCQELFLAVCLWNFSIFNMKNIIIFLFYYISRVTNYFWIKFAAVHISVGRVSSLLLFRLIDFS